MQQVEDPRFAFPQEDAQRPPPKKNGRGCLFWGCLTSAILALLLLIGGAAVIYFATKHYVLQFTTAKRENVSIAELPRDQLAELSERLARFAEAIQTQEAPLDLTLTAREINGLIAEDEALRGRVFITIANGRIGGEASFPADALPWGEGRFLSLAIDLSIAMQDGELDVRLVGAEWNGQPQPQLLLDAMAGHNLAAEAQKDTDLAGFLVLFDSLEVVDDRIVLKRKRPGVPEQPKPSPEAAEVVTP